MSRGTRIAVVVGVAFLIFVIVMLVLLNWSTTRVSRTKDDEPSSYQRSARIALASRALSVAECKDQAARSLAIKTGAFDLPPVTCSPETVPL